VKSLWQGAEIDLSCKTSEQMEVLREEACAVLRALKDRRTQEERFEAGLLVADLKLEALLRERLQLQRENRDGKRTVELLTLLDSRIEEQEQKGQNHRLWVERERLRLEQHRIQIEQEKARQAEKHKRREHALQTAAVNGQNHEKKLARIRAHSDSDREFNHLLQAKLLNLMGEEAGRAFLQECYVKANQIRDAVLREAGIAPEDKPGRAGEGAGTADPREIRSA
jgi:hypothetical protein